MLQSVPRLKMIRNKYIIIHGSGTKHAHVMIIFAFFTIILNLYGRLNRIVLMTNVSYRKRFVNCLWVLNGKATVVSRFSYRRHTILSVYYRDNTPHII